MAKDTGVNESTNSFISVLENDEIMLDIKAQVNEAKTHMCSLLARSVQRIKELSPIEKQIHNIFVVDMLIRGLSDDLCSETMDCLEPNWQDQFSVDSLVEQLADVLSNLEQVDTEGVTIH
jgi:hypothetical protein